MGFLESRVHRNVQGFVDFLESRGSCNASSVGLSRWVLK